MLKAVIVDDEKPVGDLLKILLQKTKNVEVLKTFTDSEEAYENIFKLKTDVVFLDIEMPELSGIELANLIIEKDSDIMIVFVTGYNQYALDAFRVHALDYLIKPVNASTIDKCVTRLVKLKGPIESNIQRDNEYKIICFDDFEVYGKSGPVKWVTRKVEEMLAYFIINRDTNIEGVQLGEILWPEESPTKIKSNLHTTLYRLRKTMKEENIPIEISSEKGGKGIYRCTLGNVYCDLIEFETITSRYEVVNKENIEEIKYGCEIYRDFLYERRAYDWSFAKGEKLKRSYLNMRIGLSVFYVEEKMYNEAAINLLEVADVEPFDEDIQKKLMMVYAEQKNKSMLIACYNKFIKQLDEELSTEPQEETMNLYAKLLKENI